MIIVNTGHYSENESSVARCSVYVFGPAKVSRFSQFSDFIMLASFSRFGFCEAWSCLLCAYYSCHIAAIVRAFVVYVVRCSFMLCFLLG